MALPAPHAGDPCDAPPNPRAPEAPEPIIGCGPLSRFQLREVIEAGNPGIDECSARAAPGALDSDVHLHFTIGGSGHVRSIEATPTSPATQAAIDCVLAHVRAWTFPAPAGGGTVDVRAPLRLESSDGRQ